MMCLFLQDPVVRTLCLSETCMIERDPATYIIVSCHPLSDVSFKCEVSCHFCDLGTICLLFIDDFKHFFSNFQ